MSDRGTHCGTYSIVTRSVHGRCGAEFVPLKRTTGSPIVLTPNPPSRPDLPALPGHPVSGVARCWATSPVDHAVHLLACDGDDHPTGALLARCGAAGH